MIAARLANATIAGKLGASPNNVVHHVTSIFARLKIAGRVASIVKARDTRLGTRAMTGLIIAARVGWIPHVHGEVALIAGRHAYNQWHDREPR